MEAEGAPEMMLVRFYQDTRCHDPAESSLTYRYISEGAFSCLYEQMVALGQSERLAMVRQTLLSP
jgi:hypothetical protein